jgi:hypothetical protein
MSYGKNFKVYCLNRKVGMARMTDYFLRRFAGCYALAGLGETCLANMGPGKPPTTDTDHWSKRLSSGDSRCFEKKDSNHEWHMIDGSIVKVHQDAMRSAYCKKAEHIGSSVGDLAQKFTPKWML